MAHLFRLVMGLVLLVAACGDGDSTSGDAPMDLQAYVDAVSYQAEEFDEEAAAAAAAEYPFDEELVEASGLYAVYDKSLGKMRSLTPPAEVAEQHDALVAAMSTMQEKVGDYLHKAGLEGGFSFEALNADPVVAEAVAAFFASCTALADAVRDAGATGVPTVCGE